MDWHRCSLFPEEVPYCLWHLINLQIRGSVAQTGLPGPYFLVHLYLRQTSSPLCVVLTQCCFWSKCPLSPSVLCSLFCCHAAHLKTTLSLLLQLLPLLLFICNICINPASTPGSTCRLWVYVPPRGEILLSLPTACFPDGKWQDHNLNGKNINAGHMIHSHNTPILNCGDGNISRFRPLGTLMLTTQETHNFTMNSKDQTNYILTSTSYNLFSLQWLLQPHIAVCFPQY